MWLHSQLCVATQVDGLSHVVHSEEEALGTRITIDSLTCLLANESDPSRLIASSPGKLIRYLLPDGSHVKTDQPYAEVEVSCWQTHAVHAEIMSCLECIPGQQAISHVVRWRCATGKLTTLPAEMPHLDFNVCHLLDISLLSHLLRWR